MIPKIIHQIWIGENKMPLLWMKSFYNDYLKAFPDWKYVLWTEKEIDKLNMINREIYDKEPTYWGKSDILRYELLFRFGGIYIDADSVWVNNKNLEECIYEAKNTDLFFARSHCQGQIANGVIGSSPNHPFFKEIMDKIIPRYNSMINEHVAVKIGPVFITKILENYNPTIFPPEYFYPSAWGQTEDCLLHKQVKIPSISFMYQYGYSSNLTIGGNLYKKMNEQIYSDDDYKIPTNDLV